MHIIYLYLMNYNPSIRDEDVYELRLINLSLKKFENKNYQ